MKGTRSRTVHDRWWRSERFRMAVLVLLGLAVGAVLGILDPNGVG